MARGGGKDTVLDDTALKLEGHLSVLAARAAAVHPTASTGHAHGAYVSVRERTTKARMAFPVGPLARVGGGCMELNRGLSLSFGHMSRHGRVGLLHAWLGMDSSLRF